jgi:hypothetical protein
MTPAATTPNSSTSVSDFIIVPFGMTNDRPERNVLANVSLSGPLAARRGHLGQTGEVSPQKSPRIKRLLFTSDGLNCVRRQARCPGVWLAANAAHGRTEHAP